MSSNLYHLQQEHAPRPSHAEALEAGRDARVAVPRYSHAEYTPSDRDSLQILLQQNETRYQPLVPLRMGRMASSPFAYYRGTAAIMAADLARGSRTGIHLLICGDAHISNFGLFASPQRNLVFDLNDFDEASLGPWEWDVKRLATSVIIGARDSGANDEQARWAAQHCVSAYRNAMQGFSEMTALQRYFVRADAEEAQKRAVGTWQKVIAKATRQASKRTGDAFVDKITKRGDDGVREIIDSPPVLTHIEPELEMYVEELWEDYRATVNEDISLLLSHYQLTDVARRVVGVGSVGTRCFILVLTGSHGESLVMQVKQAETSVLQQFGGITLGSQTMGQPPRANSYEHQGQRVVAAQRILQAVSDPFLGYMSAPNGNQFYVRQFRDKKGSIAVEELGFQDFVSYVDGCATLLARAHAQSSNAAMVSGYLGKSSTFDKAVVEWSAAYADQSLLDFRRLKEAVQSGDVEAVVGV